MNIDQLANIQSKLRDHERRLSAIERAATCGTGPNEPITNSPAQADVGEASAVSTCNGCGKPLLPENAWMTDGCPCNYPMGCNSPELDQNDAAEKLRAVIMAVSEYTSSPPHRRDDHSCLLCRMLESPDYKTYRGSPVLEAEARIAAARGEKPSATPTAERESGPTPGMVFMADESRGISTIRAIVECVMMNLHQNNHDFRLRDKLIVAAAPYLEKHEKETAALRESERLATAVAAKAERERNDIHDALNLARQQLTAKDSEIERLKADNARLADDYQVAVNNIGYRSEELNEARAEIARLNEVAWNARLERRKLQEAIAHPDKLFASQVECAAAEPLREARQQLAAKDAEIATLTRERDEARAEVEKVNIFARTLGYGQGELDSDLAGCIEKSFATSREAAEAMEWLAKNPYCSLYYGFQFGSHKGWYVSGFNGVFRTPTAAILAAKNAGEGGDDGRE